MNIKFQILIAEQMETAADILARWELTARREEEERSATARAMEFSAALQPTIVAALGKGCACLSLGFVSLASSFI